MVDKCSTTGLHPRQSKDFLFFPNIYIPRVLVPSKLVHKELGLVTQILKDSQETKHDGLCIKKGWDAALWQCLPNICKVPD